MTIQVRQKRLVISIQFVVAVLSNTGCTGNEHDLEKERVVKVGPTVDSIKVKNLSDQLRDTTVKFLWRGDK